MRFSSELKPNVKDFLRDLFITIGVALAVPVVLVLSFFAFRLETADAKVVHKCQVLMSATGQTSSTNGTITEILDHSASSFTVVAVATNNSGTTPTLDAKVQSCRTSSSSSCADLASFDQCTTGACYGGDSLQNIDLASDSVNVFPFFRAVTTLGGTSPNYNVTIYLCYK